MARVEVSVVAAAVFVYASSSDYLTEESPVSVEVTSTWSWFV